MAYGCSGVVFGMKNASWRIFTHKKNNRGKHALYKTNLSDLRCWSCNHRVCILMEWLTWISAEGIKQIWNYNFGIFVNFDVVLRVNFTFSYASLRCIDPDYASTDFVNNVNFFVLRVNKIRWNNTMFLNQPSFIVESCGEFFLFLHSWQDDKQKLSDSLSSFSMLSKRFYHAWGSPAYFQTIGYADVGGYIFCTIKLLRPSTLAL